MQQISSLIIFRNNVSVKRCKKSVFFTSRKNIFIHELFITSELIQYFNFYLMKKNLFFWGVAALMIGLVSCKSGNTNTENNENTEAETVELNETPGFEKAGVYFGVLPCADCSGIETTLEIMADRSYKLTQVYLEKEDGRFESSGTIVWEPETNMITLGEGEDMMKFKFEGDQLIVLDKDGNKATGELADKYVLNKK